MLSLRKYDGPRSKSFVSNGTLPAFVERAQLPSKKKPFFAILGNPFNRAVELLLPEELHDLIWQDVASKINNLKYSRVIMALSELLEGEFFNKYIKTGNILMLSEGRPGIENQYILKDGQLRLDLPKEVYERTGLVGKPIRDAGRKHMKTRFSIEIDLRQPSMLHGKKGFERIIWAFKNVLDHSVTWLFHDLDNSKDSETRPIAKHHPFNRVVLPQRTDSKAVLVPSLDITTTTGSDADFEDWVLETYEWLSLVSLGSPLVQASDSIDPYLSRYRVPTQEGEPDNPQNMVCLSWKGLIPAQWIRDLFIALNDACSKVSTASNFFAISAHALKTEVPEQRDGYTILWLSDDLAGQELPTPAAVSKKQKHAERHGREYVLWEFIDS